MMLDRDRHEEAKAAIRRIGARLQLIPDGDVAGRDPRRVGRAPAGRRALRHRRHAGGRHLRLRREGARWPDPRTPLGPQRRRGGQARDAGYDLDRQLTVDDLVTSEDSFFACTGITNSQLLKGVMFDGIGAVTHSLVMRSKSGTVRTIEARHRLKKLREFSSVAY
jgi:fructose-1,6-bisphosphatase II